MKQAFKAFSPTGVEPSPKSLRQSFICALRDENFGDSEVLKSAARAMRHAETTQGSDTYDKKTHDRLLKAAFDWCRGFAERVEDQEVPRRPQEKDIEKDTERDASEEKEEEDQEAAPRVEDEDNTVEFDAGGGADAADEPISSTLIPAAGEAPAAPMASLPSLRRIQKRQQQQLRVAPAPLGDGTDEEKDNGDTSKEGGDEYTIEAVTGGSHCEDDSVQQHRVLWEGYSLETNSWNGLPPDYAWRESASVLAQHRLVTLLPPGLARTTANRKRVSEDPLYGVCTIADEVDGPLLRLLRHNGTEVVLDMARCRMGHHEVDWLAHFEDERRLWTDAVVDWTSSQQLIEIRGANLSCEAFPSLLEARALAKALPGAIPPAAPALRQAAVELDVWLRTPTVDHAKMTLARGNAETLRKAWLPFGIIHNALSLVVGIDATQVAELQRDIAEEKRRDPAGALWDQAGL